MKREAAKRSMARARRSISFPTATYAKISAFARQHGLPMSKVMEELIEHAIRGDVAVRSAVADGTASAPPDAMKRETFLAIIRAQQAARAPRAIVVEPARTFPAGAWCAICARDCGGEPYYAEPVGRNEGMVNVCAACRSGGRDSNR